MSLGNSKSKFTKFFYDNILKFQDNMFTRFIFLQKTFII